VPDEKDWVKEGIVTDVKDQGQCGSCWAFATIASLESLAASQSKNLATFSEQQLVDCATGSLLPPIPPNFGCNGGNPLFALPYVASRGIMSEKDYPYKGEAGKCNYDSNKTVFKNGSLRPVIPFSGSALKSASSQRVIAVTIHADDIMHYQSGVYNDTNCGLFLPNDHAVTLVGYGNDEKLGDFWKVKNSWGKDWGEQGYIRFKRDDNINRGICGINMMPLYPIA